MPSVLITGANRGIGLAFAHSFAADGWRVHACCRDPDRAEDLAVLRADMASADMASADLAGAVTLLNALDKYDLKKGVAALCIGGGEATAMAVERVH